MPLMKLEFEAGINRTGTAYSAEGGWYDCNNIRFRDGRVETVGGWGAQGSIEFQGIARGMFSWADLDGNPFTVVGTDWKVYVVAGEQAYDITPWRIKDAALGSNPFNINADRDEEIDAVEYTIVEVTHSGHILDINDFVTFSGSSGSVSHNIDPAIMNAEYQVCEVVSASKYRVRIPGNVTDGQSGDIGGGSVLASYKIHSGLYAPVGGTGWGASPFGGSTETYISSTIDDDTGSSTINMGGGLTATATAITLADSSSFPVTADGCVIKIDNELILCTTNTEGTEVLTVATFAANGIDGRGVLGTVAAAHNNLATVTVAGVGMGATTIDLVDGDAADNEFPDDGGTIRVDSELMTYTGRTDDQLTGVVRGVEGTELNGDSDGSPHEEGAEVALVDTGSDWYGWGEAAAVDVGRKEIRLWSFDNNGEDLVVGVRGEKMYYWDTSAAAVNGVPNSDGTEILESITVDNTVLNEPTGTVISPPNFVNQVIISDRDGHMIALGCNDLGATDIVPTLIRWGDQDNVFDWLPSSVNTAGGQRLARGSKIIGSISTKAEVLIWTDAALYSMRFIGPPDIFAFTLISGATTLFSRHSVVAAANMVFFMGESDFYVYQGTINPLPSTVAKYIFDDICKDAKEKIFCGSNRQFSEVMWFYPSSGALDVDRYVCFNYLDRTWSFGSFDMERMSNASPLSTSTSRTRTSWQDLEIDPNPSATYMTNFNNNRQNDAGDPINPPIETSSIVTHEFGRQAFTVGIDTFIQSAFFDIAEGDQYMLYTKLIPDLKILDGTTGSSVDISIVNDDYPLGLDAAIQPESEGISTVTVNPLDVPTTENPTTTGYQGYTNFRGRTRSVAVRYSATANGYGWRLGATRLNLQPDGRR